MVISNSHTDALFAQGASAAALETQLLDPSDGEARLELAIRAWIDSQESERTRETYAQILGRFRSALQALQLDLDSERRGDIGLIAEKWCRAKHDSSGRPLGGRVGDPTFVQRLSAISSFYVYAIRYELLSGPNPIARIKRPARQEYRNVEERLRLVGDPAGGREGVAGIAGCLARAGEAAIG